MTYEKYVSRKTIPTTCKFCRKRVFYHTNEYGSKVFFNELGRNWSVHEYEGYLLAKSMSGNFYSGMTRKSDVLLTRIKTVFKPKAILLKKNGSANRQSFTEWV